MSNKTITKLNVSADPFKDGVFSIVDKFTNNQMVDVGDVYHKTSKIKFLKTEEQDAEQLISTDIRTYVRSETFLPEKANDITALLPPAGGTYSLTTFRNPNGFNKPFEELETPTFYDNETLNKRNIVFNSGASMIGTPNSDYSVYKTSNIIYMTYPNSGELSSKLTDANNFLMNYNFSLYERFMILVGHYSDSISTIQNDETITLGSIVENYNYPFPVDAYHIITDKPTTSLSFDAVQHELFKQIRKTISKNSMNYENIFLDEQCPDDFMFFKVEKWFSETFTRTPDQVFFLPATEENKLFIDLQIKENKFYYYRTTLHYAVFGQEYYFSDIVDNGTFGECVVNVRPKISLEKAILFEGSMRNIPAPPLAPLVSFHSKKSEINRIRIYLELQSGELILKPIDFGVDDVENQIGTNYNLSTPVLVDGGTPMPTEVLFRSEKQRAKFQVYRISEYPKFYRDFSDGLIGTFENNNMASSMMIIDIVKPNKKYYYTFRTFNEFESYSNPTVIYEVELIKDADESKVSVKTIQIEEDEYEEAKEKLDRINFKSLIDIGVSEDQTEFNIENLVNEAGFVTTFIEKLNEVKLGEAVEFELKKKIWGKKFKFRFKSNESGKTIDLNLKANLIRDEGIEPEPPLASSSQQSSGTSQSSNNMSMADLLAALQGQGSSNMTGGN
jgi:hypothetical protein